MRQSELFTKTLRDAPKDEEAINAKLLIRGGFVDKVMAGVYTLLPLGLRVFKKIEGIIREEITDIGAQELLMPSLHPKANWEKTGRWEAVDDLFRFTSYYTKTDLVLSGTHEEIIAPLAKKFVASYRDLPFAAFQIQNKFRDEKRARSGLLRGREFVMKDLYSFHADEHDLDRYYEIVKDAYARIFERVGIGGETYLTYASGGTFSKYSHEFQTITDAGEDVIYLCPDCRVAVNKEILSEQKTCPNCGRSDLEEKKATEVGNIFKLKTKYSAPFALTYKDKEGKEQEVMMGCYGIGLQRLMAVAVERFHEEKGIIWPVAIAPFAVHLIELQGASGKKIYEDLKKKGVEVLYDDRELSAGEKFADADLIGIPWRAVVSPKTGAKIELKARREEKNELVSLDAMLKILKV